MKYVVSQPSNSLKQRTKTMIYGEIEKIDDTRERGIFTVFKGDIPDFKGHIYPEPVRVSGTVKRVLKATIELFLSKQFIWFFLPIVILPRFIKKKLIKRFVRWFENYSTRAFDRYHLKEHRFCKSGREILRAGFKLYPEYKRTFYNIAMIWEYDWKYRLMFQDVAGELENLENPRKELIRLLDVFIERAGNETGIIRKARRAKKLVEYAPGWILKETARLLEELDDISLDDDDFYFCLEIKNYNHRGMDYTDKQILKQIKYAP